MLEPQYPYEQFFSENSTEEVPPGVYPDELYGFLLSGQHDKLLQLQIEVCQTHEPTGILGGNKDRLYWNLFEIAILIHFEKQDHRVALSLMDEYEKKRIAIGLTPIPHYFLQKKIIGCLAQVNPKKAIKKLKLWLAKSKARNVCDVIKQHEAFRHLFGYMPPSPNIFVPGEPLPRLTSEQKSYVNKCIKLAQSQGIKAHGSPLFELVLPNDYGKGESIPLETLYAKDESSCAILSLIKEAHARQISKTERIRSFVEDHLQTVLVSSDSAIAEWTHRVAQFPESGMYPVILSDSISAGDLVAGMAKVALCYDEEISSATRSEAMDWFAGTKSELEASGEITSKLIGKALRKSSKRSSLPTEITFQSRRKGGKITIALLKVTHPWHIPILVEFGGWNTCPDPICQARILRHWYTHYGASIACLGGDVLECTVARPPDNLVTAFELAWEQYLYCPDLVEQGTYTIGRLAETLVDSEYWSFWWD